MNKAFILDLNILAEQNISLKEFNTLLKLNYPELDYDIDDNVLNSLQDKQYIKLITDEERQIIVREKSKLLLEFLLIEGLDSVDDKKKIRKSSRAINTELDTFVKEYRSLWKGLKLGSMGSEASCKDKLYRWMTENPQYSKEDIYKAAQIYLKSVENYQFLQQADYFIYKKDAHGESSRLSAFIDEIDSKINEDWTSKLN